MDWLDQQEDLIHAHECVWGVKQTKRACHLWCANHFQRLVKRIERLKELLSENGEVGEPAILACQKCQHHPTLEELEQITKYRPNNLGAIVTKKISLKIALWYMTQPPRYGHTNEAQ